MTVHGVQKESRVETDNSGSANKIDKVMMASTVPKQILLENVKIDS